VFCCGFLFHRNWCSSTSVMYRSFLQTTTAPPLLAGLITMSFLFLRVLSVFLSSLRCESAGVVEKIDHQCLVCISRWIEKLQIEDRRGVETSWRFLCLHRTYSYIGGRSQTTSY
jgi:hypothetical protein